MIDWKPDPILLLEARTSLERLVLELAETALSESEPGTRGGPATAGNREVLKLLEAAGTLSFLQEGETAKDCIAPIQGDLEVYAEEALNAFGAERVDEAALEILTAAVDLPLAGEDERDDLERRIEDALDLRDGFEFAVEGARLILGRAPEVDDELLASVVAFDDLLRPELWRMLPLGERRAAKCLWAAPSRRHRLWWWYRGCELSETALDDLATAAQVLHLFPEARRELDRLILAEETIEDFVRGKEDPPVAISLRDRFREKIRLSRGASLPHKGIRLAAGDLDETVILETREVTLSTSVEALIVDIESPAEPRADAPPVLEAEGLEPLVGVVTQEPGRFIFPLLRQHFSGGEAKLTVFLRQGERVLHLPPA